MESKLTRVRFRYFVQRWMNKGMNVFSKKKKKISFRTIFHCDTLSCETIAICFKSYKLVYKKKKPSISLKILV